jgi:pimeloyl-ACP methyl ester carboxylesterase
VRRRRALIPWLVAAVAVVGGLFAWVPDLPFEQPRARWAPTPSAFLTVDGMSVHLRDEGPRNDGEPVESSVRDAYADPGRITPALIDRYYELALRAGNRRALVQRFRQVPPGVDAERIRTIAVPTLVLWGRDDRIVPVEWAERFHEEIAGSRLVILDGLGHVPQEEDPERSLEPVEAFLG